MFAWSAMEKNDDGWDLFAVVRSCRAASRPAAPPAAPPSPANHSGEIEKLCKPFIAETQQPKPSPLSCSSAAPRRPISQPIHRSKKRRNLQKRVVCEVPVDGVSADMWAWRKYGQKPIKGSPYPRGYYRCSSSKGCLARKQVERSRTDPSMFVLTYTGEHSHSPPSHRNSLAGSTRQRFSPAVEGAEQGSVSLKKQEIVEEEEEDEEEEEEDEDEGMLLVEDMEVLGDDEVLFMGMKKLDESPAAAGKVDEFCGGESCCFDDSLFCM